MSFNFSYNYPQLAKEAGFKLRQYKDGPLDWHLIGSVEIERMLRDQNLEQIDAVLTHLSEVPLGSMLETNILDSGIAKYFILSQFAVQYLLFCRQFVESSAGDLREAHGLAQIEIAKLKSSLSDANNEILQLHKKLTHMEAIHEVIYPCHLCSKNFISNDALNLHISRKHNASINKSQGRTETPKIDGGVHKERENDLYLINTIKLELEIKHLKERLNKAEREIREGNSKKSTPRDQIKNNETESHGTAVDAKTMQSVGIQSNLMEIKEKNDYSEEDLSQSADQKEQFSVIQDKLKSFEEWKEKQKQENCNFLQEIDKKLKHLTETYEITKTQHVEQSPEKSEEAKLRASPTPDHIEQLLNNKIDDIRKQNETKLEEVINRLELNYREKIEELKTHTRNEEIKNTKKEKFTITCETSCTQTENVNINKTHDVGGYNVNKDEIRGKMEKPKESCSSGSNETYVKDHDSMTKDGHVYVKTEIDNKNSSDDTDVSESLQDESSDSATSSSEKEIPQEIASKKIPKQLQQQKEIIKDKRPKRKLYTRSDAKKLMNYRLKTLGVDVNTKAISQTALTRINSDLQEKRYQLKHKYPKLHVTRNRIKKFVDRLCSTKMSAKAEAILKQTQPKKPQKQIINQTPIHEHYIVAQSNSDLEESLNVKASTPLNATYTLRSNEFKERLERILASPIMKPLDYNQHQAGITKPIPLPRKRVMFNQTEVPEHQTDESSNYSDHRNSAT